MAFGKFFHRILSIRLEKFALNNRLLNPSFQKGFLYGVNGTTEHIFSTDSLLDNARTTKNPVVMSFLDLKNAFGSVCHQYLFDILQYIKLPSAVVSYITSYYSKLTAYVSTKKWKTTVFSIYRGVFQGDTLSPILFNLAINLLLAYLSTSEDCGYSAQLLASNFIGLPPVEVPIYVLRSDSSDDSPSGWYRAKVTSYHCDGSCDLAYDNGDSEQSVDLHVVEWCYTSRYRKVYRPDKPSTQPSTSISAAATLPKICYLSLHKAKGFVDDLTVISNDVKSHQQVLSSLVLKAIDICLEVQPLECISLNFNGHRMVSSTVFSMADGNTVNIYL